MLDNDAIPLVDLTAQRLALGDAIEIAIKRVFAKSDFILGEEVSLFEHEFAVYCGVPYAIGVASGTDALQLACRALDIGAGDEVIVPAMTFAATAFAVSLTGARPVFVDVLPDTALIDSGKIEQSITHRTRAIIAVHLYGQCADMEAICAVAAKYSLSVIEDAAQAHGATRLGKCTGSFGDIGCFSFYPGKNLGAYGDGGMVTTARHDIAERIEMLRNCGARVKYFHAEIGLNSRLDTLQAAVLREKLKYLDQWNKARQQIAAYYDSKLSGIDGIQLCTHGPGSAHHLYVIRVGQRKPVLAALNARRIGASIHYPFALHQLKAYASLGYSTGDFPVAEDWAARCLSLPLYPELSICQSAACATVVKDAVAALGSPQC